MTIDQDQICAKTIKNIWT